MDPNYFADLNLDLLGHAQRARVRRTLNRIRESIASSDEPEAAAVSLYQAIALLEAAASGPTPAAGQCDPRRLSASDPTVDTQEVPVCDDPGQTCYPTRAAATTAAREDSNRHVPYRIWKCRACDGWHAAPWISRTS